MGASKAYAYHDAACPREKQEQEDLDFYFESQPQSMYWEHQKVDYDLWMSFLHNNLLNQTVLGSIFLFFQELIIYHRRAINGTVQGDRSWFGGLQLKWEVNNNMTISFKSPYAFVHFICLIYVIIYVVITSLLTDHCTSFCRIPEKKT